MFVDGHKGANGGLDGRFPCCGIFGLTECGRWVLGLLWVSHMDV